MEWAAGSSSLVKNASCDLCLVLGESIPMNLEYVQMAYIFGIDDIVIQLNEVLFPCTDEC